MSKVYDVIIAGGGPVGLFLACELGLARASVLVLERDLKHDKPWQIEPLGMRGTNSVTVEAFYRRGLLSKIYDLSERALSFQKTPGFQWGGHFAGIMLNANKLELDRWKYRIPGPAMVPGPTTIERVEMALTERAEGLGVTILKGLGVTKLGTQDDDGVTVEAGVNQSFRGKWLVGCDGGRSVVRKAAGFDFVGTEAKFTGYAVKCRVEPHERLKPGFNPTKNGMYIQGPSETLYLMDFDGGAFDRTQEITKEHIQEVLRRISGILDVKISTFDYASVFTDRSKQATSYRKGRVLLAGDAAHILPPVGSQGLNTGLGDAMNLGWKLAATIRRDTRPNGTHKGLELLDTYESERHPVGASVLEWTRAQVATLEPGSFAAAVQGLVRDLIDTTDGTNLFIDRFWGLSQRYKLGDEEAHTHPLVGSTAPDFELDDGSRLGSKLESGRGLLVDFEDDTALKELVVGGECGARVDYIGMRAKDTRGLRALLVRPDGIVAWVAEHNGELNLGTAKAALERWFGF